MAKNESSGRSRALIWLGSLFSLALIAAGTAGYRAQRAVPEQLRQRALQQGFELEYGTVSAGPFATAMRNVKVRVKNAPFLAASVDEMSVRGALFGAQTLAVDGGRIVLSGEPSTIFDGLLAIPKWNGGAVSWGSFDVEYAHRVFGSLALGGVRVEQRDNALIVNTTQVRLGVARWQDVLFSIHRRNQMIEVGLSDPSPKTAQVQLGYYPPSRGAAQWTLSLVHQPARAVAQRFGWDPGPDFDAASVAGTLSFVVPSDRSIPIRGLLQLIMDRWPRPNWPESDALLGGAASFLARVVPTDDMLRWDFVHTEISTALFSMVGTGRLVLGPSPSIGFDVRGTRTCAQLQGNTAPSTYLSQVNAYLEQPNGKGVEDRRREQAALRLQLFAEKVEGGNRSAAWHLGPGCGLTELSEGAFITLELPQKEEPAKK